MKLFVESLLFLLGVHLSLGGVFAGVSHGFLLKRVDPSAASAGCFFRALITPGMVALWPLLACLWWPILSGKRDPDSPPSWIHPPVLRVWHRSAWWSILFLVPLILVTSVVYRSRPPVSDSVSLPSTARSPSLLP